MKIDVCKEGSKKIPLKVCKPLDRISVAVISPADSGKLELRVTDGANQPYVVKKMSLQNGQSSFSFLAGGQLGKHHICVSSSGNRCETLVRNFTLQATTEIKDSSQNYKLLFERTSDILKSPRCYFSLGNKTIKGVSWLRDHAHCMKGYKYWEKGMKSMVDYFLKHQMDSGGYYDFFAKKYVVNSAFANYFPEKTVTFWRIDCEADLEYLMVEAAYTVWQATGDDKWIKARLYQLEKGLVYTMTNPERWSKELSLAKRPFTIDTWDFEHSAAGGNKDGKFFLRQNEKNGFIIRKIDENTRFCIMHGDNSGLLKACRLLEKIYDYFGNKVKGQYWRKQANKIRQQTNRICWNGKFYRHQVHIDPVEVPIDENQQLSLSNTYDINRELPSHQQAVSIIREYQRREKGTDSFAEWFSIDPPFPTGVFPKMWGDANGYINGTVMPLVAGELAKACFEHGFEKYGTDILLRLLDVFKLHGKIYFMYNRDGSPWTLKNGKEGGPSEWGAAAVVYALMEGLAGIEDMSKLYQEIKVSPKWVATGDKEVSVTAKYAASKGYFAYRYLLEKKNRMIIDFTGSGNMAKFHILLPEGTEAVDIRSGNTSIKGHHVEIEKSRYLDFNVPVSIGTVTINLKAFKKRR